MDKQTGRVVALFVLLIVAGAALRGYLPAPGSGPRAEPGSGRAALTFVVAALGGTVALMAVAVVARLRDPRAAAPRVGELPGMLGAAKGRTNWRVLLIGLAILVVWLVAMTWLSRFLAPHVGSPPAPSPDTGASAPAQGSAPPPRPQHPRQDSADMLGILFAGAVPVMLMLVGGTLVMSRRRWRPPALAIAVEDPVETPVPPARSGSLVRAAERGLAEMTDFSREPREAIIACYAAMERELANFPGAVPQDCDTPTEVLARAVEHHALRADNATQLVTLFTEARFSRHVMNEGHRDMAVRVLRLVLDELGRRRAA